MAGSNKNKSKNSNQAKKRQAPSLLEWIASAIGAVIALTLLGFLVAEAVQTSSGEPPMIDVQPIRAVAGDRFHVVEVRVRNRSGATASAVQIEGRLMQAGKAVETSSATLAYVPGNSERRAGLIFNRDPQPYTVEAGATGYEQP